jgi:hypothetical protein
LLRIDFRDKSRFFTRVFYVELFAAGVAGEPAFADALTLLEDFEDAPKTGEGGYGQEGLPKEVADHDGGGAGNEAAYQEGPPAFDTKIVFALNH